MVLVKGLAASLQAYALPIYTALHYFLSIYVYIIQLNIFVAYVEISLCVHAYIRMYVCMYACTYVCMYARVHTGR